MAPKAAKPSRKKVLISLAVSIAILVTGYLSAENITGQILFSQLFWPLIRLMAVITLGLVAGEIIEASGWTGRLGLLARPAFRFAKLSDHCSAAFSTAFFSGTAANAMLADFYEDKKINKEQLFLTNLLNHFPAYFLHLPTTVFIVVPLTGRAGAWYFLLTFSALLLRTGAVLLYGHYRPTRACPPPANRFSAVKVHNRARDDSILARLQKKLPGRIATIAVYVIPIYIVVFVLNRLGLFALVRNWISGFVVTTFIPVESLSIVIVSFAAEFTSGFAAAGALMDANVITFKQTVLALLIGNIVAFPVRVLRHQLPRYMGIFSPRMGLELLILGQGCRITSLMAVGIIFFLL